ncbi:MAG: alpha/beta fold hydrolase [Pirellulales bacterium]
MPTPDLALFAAAYAWYALQVLGWFVALNVLFWIYVWIRYFPIVQRLIGESTLLVAEPSESFAGGQDCEFRSVDGLTLRGTYLKTTSLEGRRGVVLFGHELNGDRWNATPYVRDLIASGYDVLTFDFRNHGASDVQADLTMRPWVSPKEVNDLRAAVDYLMSRPDADPRGVGVLAISRAAGAAVCLAAEDSRIRCLFTDGAYPTHSTQLMFLKRYIDIYVPPPWTFITRRIPDWIYHIFLAVARRRWGRRHRFEFLNVEQQAARVTVPVMMIHGEKDRMIPVASAQALRRCIKSPAKLVVVSGAKHNGAVFAEPENYLRRVRRFFDFHLAPRTTRTSKRPLQSIGP